MQSKQILSTYHSHNILNFSGSYFRKVISHRICNLQNVLCDLQVSVCLKSYFNHLNKSKEQTCVQLWYLALNLNFLYSKFTSTSLLSIQHSSIFLLSSEGIYSFKYHFKCFSMNMNE